MLPLTTRALLLVALLAGTVLALPAPEPPPLPENAVASVHGRILTHDDLMAETVRKLGRDNKTVLDRMLVSLAIRAEAARRKVRVEDSEIDAYIAKIERDAGGAKNLDAVLEKEGRTRTMFRTMLHLSLLGQKMAAADLKSAGAVDPAQFDLWRTELLKRLGAETDPKTLPGGVVARVDRETITTTAFGEEISREIGDGILGEKVLEPWIVVIAIDRELAKQEITVSDEEVDADLMRRKKEFEAGNQARTLKVTFEQMLSAQSGRTLDDLRRDREYRSVLGLRKMIAARLKEAELRAWFTKREESFGETRNVQLIQIQHGRDKQFGTGGRTAAEARRLATDLAARLRAGEAWETVATHGDNKKRDPVPVTPDTSGPPELMKAIRTAEAGAIVGPVGTLNAFHLLRVTAILPPKTFEEVRNDVEKAVLKEQERKFMLALRTDPGVVRAERFR